MTFETTASIISLAKNYGDVCVEVFNDEIYVEYVISEWNGVTFEKGNGNDETLAVAFAAADKALANGDWA